MNTGFCDYSQRLFTQWKPLVALLATVVLLVVTKPTQAATQFSMPSGGTSWVELSSNSCGGDCVGDATSIGPSSFSPLPGFAPIQAAGLVGSDSINLTQQTAGNTGGFTFLWGATGGTFTLHGEGSTAVAVKANFDARGTLVLSHTTQYAQVNMKIGNWNYLPVSSDLNFRVSPTLATTNFGFTFNQAAAGSYNFDKHLDYTLAVTPGSSFNLGFRAESNLLHATGSGVSASINSVFGFDMPTGYYVTGDNGFDSRTLQPVPEPETYAMLLAGLALVMGIARRKFRPSLNLATPASAH